MGAQETRVAPPLQPRMLGVYTNFINLGSPRHVPNGGLLGGNWNWNGYLSSGCQITSVTPGSVAAMARLEVGDTILSLNGMPMTSPYALQRAVNQCQGQNVMCWVINIRTGQLTSVWCNFGGGPGQIPASPDLPIPASPAH